MRSQPEAILREQLGWYIRNQYPDLLVRFDTTADIKLKVGQAMRAKRLNSERGFPDLLILEQRGGYGACFLELKADGVAVYKADGSLRSDRHLEEQEAYMERLRAKGYMAVFAVGYDEAVTVIDTYMSLPATT